MSEKKKLGKTVFDQINGINTKDYNFEEKEYNPYVANLFYSFFPDTVFFSNEMNKYRCEKKANHDFYFYGIPRKKRYTKWIKSQVDMDTLLAVRKYYYISEPKALEIIPLLSEDEIEAIKEELEEGGRE